MDQESEVIRQQMEETRASLSEKLETLEQQVVGTVQQATSAVSETVENVKEAVEDTVGTVKHTVSDTVEAVKETFDLRRQFERHPCAMFGGSIAAGFVAGYFLEGSRSRWSRRRGEYPRTFSAASHFATEAPRDTGRAEGPGQPASARQEPSAASPGSEHRWLGQITSQFAPELNKLKGLAIGALMGLLRDTVTGSMNHEIATHLREVIDDMTTKLGGQPIHSPLLSEQGASSAERRATAERSYAAGGRPMEASRY